MTDFWLSGLVAYSSYCPHKTQTGGVDGSWCNPKMVGTFALWYATGCYPGYSLIDLFRSLTAAAAYTSHDFI